MVAVAVQELLPQLMTILRRGRDSAAVYGILEGYLLLGGVAVLQGYEATLAAALQSTLSKLLQTLMSPPQPAQPAGSPPSRPGGTPYRLHIALTPLLVHSVLLRILTRHTCRCICISPWRAIGSRLCDTLQHSIMLGFWTCLPPGRLSVGSSEAEM